MDAIVGDVIHVRGISQKGKNRISEHGDLWEVVHCSPHVAWCSGPAVVLKSIATGYERGMARQGDTDFEFRWHVSQVERTVPQSAQEKNNDTHSES